MVHQRQEGRNEEKEQTNKGRMRPTNKQNNFLPPEIGRIHGGLVCLCYLDDVCVGPAFVRLIVLGVFEEHFVHVSACILEELVWVIENNEGNLAVTQHTQLISFLHQTKLPFGKGHLWIERERLDREKKIMIEMNYENWKLYLC